MGAMVRPLLDLRYVLAAASVLLVAALGATVFLVYQNAGIMRDQINADFNQQQLILARQASAQIQASLQDIAVELGDLRRRVPGMPPAVRDEAMSAAFERTQVKGLVEIGLLSGDDRRLVRSPQPGAELTDAARVAEACTLSEAGRLALGSLWVEPQTSEQPVMGILCVGMEAAGGASLFATLNVSRLVARAIGEIRSGKTGYAWAIDRQGMFLFHADRDFIGRNAFAARQERQPYISFSQINRIMRDRMLLGEEGTGTYVSGWHRGERGEITKLIAFTPVSTPMLLRDQDWSVAVVAPIAEVAEAVHRVYVRHVAAEAVLIAGMFAVGLLGFLYQRRLSEALQRRIGQQENYMSSILQNSVDAIIFVDNDNRVQVWNRGAELIFGYRSDEMVGQTFHRLIPPDVDAEQELSRIRDAIRADGYVRDYIAPRVTKDGRRITVDLSRTNVRSAGGEVIGSTVIIKDVTEKMQLEQKIYNAEKLASIGVLAAGVAHEINNPLSIILGFTELLLERFPPGTPEHDDLQIIAENGEHARKIVEDLLGFARITEGLEDTVDVQHCVARVIRIVENMLVTKKIELQVEVPPSLPRVRGDAREFQQVLFNLVNNSVAAMEAAGGRLTVSARASEHWVHVTVADTGCGIPDDIKPRIFDPFFTTKQVGQGTGLGLSLCYGIVSKYGGTINFWSVAAADHPEGPTGTTFTVSMPVAEASGPADTA
jgi:PAS domain S-box-containing protein